MITVKRLLGLYPLKDEALKAYKGCACGRETGSSFENGWDSAVYACSKLLQEKHAKG